MALVGVFVWLVLLLLFDQHRRERLEAMEAEALAGEGAASVFEEGAADLRLASKRLQTWYRFVLPISSILIGAALVGLGTIVRHDPSVLELADMPPGWSATRATKDSPWRRVPPNGG